MFLVNGGSLNVLSNMLYNTTYFCEYNGVKYLAGLNNDSISCFVPQSLEGKYLLTVYQGSSAVKDFFITYVNTVNITSAFPEFITELTTEINITGNGFYQNMNCFVDNVISVCKFISNQAISCAFNTKTKEIQVFCYNIDNSFSNTIVIKFIPIPIITNLLPNTFFEGLNNLVYIQGYNFTQTSVVKISCDQDFLISINYIDTNLIFINTFMNYCSLFSLQFLSFSSNSVDFSSEIQLNVLPIPNLSSLSFYSSPYLGGEILTFQGNGFVNNIFCDFEGVLVSATINSYEEGTCVVPYHDVSTVLFSLKYPGLDYVGNYLNYTFDDLIRFTIVPNSGSESGGTIITLIGEFSTLTDIVCDFEGILVVANVRNNVTCIAPAGTGNVLLSFYSQGMLYSSYIPVYYHYIPYPTLNSLNVDSSPTLGNSTVIISGSGFVTNYHWQCLFGSLLTEAIFLNSSYVLCYSPSQPSGTVTLSLTTNNRDFTNFLSFYYTSDISIRSLYPNIGPGTGSSTTTITGKSIANAIYCKIGHTISTGIISNTGIQCITPVW